MNLQENINRIKRMMGLINESYNEDELNKILDKDIKQWTQNIKR